MDVLDRLLNPLQALAYTIHHLGGLCGQWDEHVGTTGSNRGENSEEEE